jgi:hypothetical protein
MLHTGHFSLTELRCLGFTAKQIVKAGLAHSSEQVAGLREAGYGCKGLLGAGVAAEALLSGGFRKADLEAAKGRLRSRGIMSGAPPPPASSSSSASSRRQQASPAERRRGGGEGVVRTLQFEAPGELVLAQPRLLRCVPCEVNVVNVVVAATVAALGSAPLVPSGVSGRRV